MLGKRKAGEVDNLEVPQKKLPKHKHEEGEQPNITNTEEGNTLHISDVPCIQPAFRNQEVYKNPGLYPLDDSNYVVISRNVLNSEQLEQYISNACRVERKTGRSGFGMKPRKEVCYSIDGKPYTYSRVQHKTIRFPDHVMKVIPIFLDELKKIIPDNKYTMLSTGVDIIYSSEFPRGGSISAHSDDEDSSWGLVMIFSLGQTRWLRVRNKSSKKWYNVQLKHNSLVCMHGSSFQSLYTHQVDKLSPRDSVHPRLSLNIRFKPEEEEEENTGDDAKE